MNIHHHAILFAAAVSPLLATFAAAQSDSFVLARDQPVARIIGGVPVEKGEYPFYGVSAAAGFCGCSLIHPDILLTAAHCISAFSPGQTVFLNNIERSGSDGIAVTARETFSHPLYAIQNRFDHDYMLVKIDEDMSEIPTPKWNTDPSIPGDDETCLNFGFGRTEDGGVSEALLKVQLASINQEQCDEFFEGSGGAGLVTDQMICAGDELGRSSCSGDSGSPLMFGGEIVGVVSWGSTDCGNGTPSVFARLSQVDLFIKEGICSMTEVLEPEYCEQFTDSPTMAPTTTPPPPGNDQCGNAVSLSTGATSGSTQGATFDDIGFCDTINSGPGVWYTIEGDGSNFIVDTCDEGTSFDTRLTVLSGDCGSLTCVAGNDQGTDCGENGGSRATWTSEVGVTYYVHVHGNFQFTGNFNLNVESFVPPPNDECPGAIDIEVGSVVAGSTELATVEDPGVDCFTTVRAPSLWYKTIGTGATFIASTCEGTDFDTVLNVYSGSCGSLACEGANDQSCGDQSVVEWDSIAGEEYFILVHAFFTGDAGTFELSLVDGGPPAVDDDEIIVPPIPTPPPPTSQPPTTSTCDSEDFLEECETTSGCGKIYATAVDCSKNDGGICLCAGGDVCGCVEPPSTTCGPGDLEGECETTNDCQDSYPAAVDCKKSAGGVCFCPGNTVCGCDL